MIWLTWGFFERLRKEDHSVPPSEGIKDKPLTNKQIEAMEDEFQKWLEWRAKERKRREGRS